MSPAPPIAHLLGIALGVFGGLWLGGVVAPDLPSAETDPGVVAEEEVKGSDPESLYRPGPLQEAVTQTLDQLGAGAEVSVVTIEPSRLSAAENEGTNLLPLEDMPVDAPERIVAALEEARRAAGGEGPVTLDDVIHFSWTPANPTSSEWYVLLDVSTVGPPTEFTASRDGSRVSAGSP
jgi:hypothetical protein